MNLFKSTLIATALVAAGFAGNADAAGSANTTFKVNINIDGSCLFISADNIEFGTTNAQPGTRDASGKLKVQCTNALPFTLQLDAGLNGGGDINARKMASGAGGTIAYQLFKGPGFTDVWGNTGTDAATGIGTGFGASHDQEFTVSARATLIGTETATSYTDTITATVTY